MKSKAPIYILIVIIIAVGLLLWGKKSAENLAGSWENTGVACLGGGHQNASLHIHARLSIETDGIKEIIPANIGVSPTCMAETHTHETDGVIHVESAGSRANITLGDFFSVWNEDLNREGFDLEVMVNGVNVEPSSYVIKDSDVITFTYTTSSETSSGEQNENIKDSKSEVKIGDEIVLSGVTIKPTLILEDSRCPIDVNCIQAGTLRVETSLRSSSLEESLVFELNKELTFGNKTITLVSAEPEPVSTKMPYTLEDYSFVFKVSE